MEEIWKDVVGYESLYEVSNLGHIRSLPRKKIMPLGNVCLTKERILVPKIDKLNYCSVTLRKDNVSKDYRVHRLVAQAFIPNPNNYPIINHKDENPLNNSIDNLEWCTYKYNSNYGTIRTKTEQNENYRNRHEKINYKSKTRNRKISISRSIKVYQYDKELNLIKEWESAREANRKGKFNSSHISSCCHKKRKFHKGFIWSHKVLEKN